MGIKRIILVILLVLGLYLMPAVSASVAVSGANSAYNIGDKLDTTITLIPANNTYDFLTSKLVCGADEVIIYKTPLSANMGEAQNLPISVNLNKVLIGDLNGNCHINALYGAESADSNNFEISAAINVSAQAEKVLFDPNEAIKISGTAVKNNGNPANGFVDVNLWTGTSSSSVKDGKFSASLAVPADTPGGSYNLTVHAYERDDIGRITNEGSYVIAVRVNQVLKSIDIALSSPTINPGDDLTYTILAYDQADNEIKEKDSSVAINHVNESLFAKEVVKSGNANTFQTRSNYTSGEWIIAAKIDNMSSNKLFNIPAVENVSYNLENSTLIVSNNGNIEYKKTVTIYIGNDKFDKEIELKIGEVKKYTLSAPDGEYYIEVDDGKTYQLGKVSLTGSAIGISDLDSEAKSNLLIIIWLLVIIVLLILAIYYYKKVYKGPYYGSAPKTSFVRKSFARTPPVDAGNMIQSGEKQESSVVTLKIKNMEEIERVPGPATEALSKITFKAKGAKARVYADGAYRTFVFAEALTKEKDNNMKAIKLAKEIERDLNEHNRKFAQKIDFGIGINSGEMIVEAMQGNVKFHSLGNLIIFAKKMAENANREIFVSDILYRKLLGKIKGEKVREQNYWKVGSIVDRGQHSEFINRFLKK